jgi:hypothetical protein
VGVGAGCATHPASSRQAIIIAHPVCCFLESGMVFLLAH